MDYFHNTHRATYYSTPETDSSSSSSPDQNINDRFRFASIDSSIFPPPDQLWDPVDPSALDGITDFNGLSLRQPSADSEQTIVPPSKVRRRAQNRASQRAFRERKEKHVKGLETQLELLHEKHQDLLCSYNKQSESVLKMNRKVAKLSADLRVLKACSAEEMGGGGGGGMDLSPRGRGQYEEERGGGSSLPRGGLEGAMPDKFDAFSFAGHSAGVQSMLYDGYELGLDGTIVNTVDGATSSMAMDGATARSQGLPEFEDLLHMS